MTPAQDTATPRTRAYYDHKDRKRPLASQEDRPFCEELERELSQAVKVAGEALRYLEAEAESYDGSGDEITAKQMRAWIKEKRAKLNTSKP